MAPLRGLPPVLASARVRAVPPLLALWLLVAGCAGDPAVGPQLAPPTATDIGPTTPPPRTPAATPPSAPTSTLPPSPAATPTAAAACQPAEQIPLQSGSHLIGGNRPPVPYNSTPPTSGWHSSGAPRIAVQPPAEPLSEPEQVSVLEAGGVVVTYGALDEAARARLEQHVGEHHAGSVAVTAYDQLQDGEVAFTAWGVLQRCDGVDLAALDAFAAAHAGAEVHGH